MEKTRTIKWTAGSGNNIEISMVAQFGLDRNANRKTNGEIEIDINTTIDGESLGGMAHLENVTGHPVAVAKITNGTRAIYLTQENLNKYNSALSELSAIAKPINDACFEHAKKLEATSELSRTISQTP